MKKRYLISYYFFAFLSLFLIVDFFIKESNKLDKWILFFYFIIVLMTIFFNSLSYITDYARNRKKLLKISLVLLIGTLSINILQILNDIYFGTFKFKILFFTFMFVILIILTILILKELFRFLNQLFKLHNNKINK